jgi:hypothetical protein
MTRRTFIRNDPAIVLDHFRRSIVHFEDDGTIHASIHRDGDYPLCFVNCHLGEINQADPNC